MSTIAIRDEFLAAADDWICAGYGLLLRYLAIETSAGKELLAGSLYFQPLQSPLHDFSISTGPICAGQRVIRSMTKKGAIHFLKNALNGRLEDEELHLELPAFTSRELDFYSDMHARDRWFTELQLKVTGSHSDEAGSLTERGIEHALRKINIPFDGLNDLCSWLEFESSAVLAGTTSINIRISPPAILEFSEKSLASGELKIALKAHARLDIQKLSVALRFFPGKPAESRMQVGANVKWGSAKKGVRTGELIVHLPDADRALIMLTVGSITAQRQWFTDPLKTVNFRLLATQFYDENLKQIRQSIFSPNDGRKFEQAIACLLFILGFSPAVQLESDAPDLIVTSPNGALVVVECTIKIADFQSKIGKLIDRHHGLSKALISAQHHGRIRAVLVCSLSRAQIAVTEQELAQSGIVLVCKEQLEEAFLQINTTPNADAVLENLFRTTLGETV